jgi:hypothetical protein
MRRSSVAAAVALLLVTGCSPREADERSAADVAVAFHAAFAASDGRAACSVLTVSAAHEVEKSSSSACAEGVLEEELTDPGPALRTEVFGDEAWVRFGGETVFLTHDSSGWRVSAAGCQPSPREPYDCMIDGG